MSLARGPSGIAESWAQRAPERSLLGWCVVCVALGFCMLWGSSHFNGDTISAPDLLPLVLYGVSLSALHLMLVLARFRGDQLIVTIAAFLCGFGLLVQYRMGSFETQDPISLNLALFPAGCLLMGAVCTILMRGRYSALGSRNWMWAWGGLSLGLLGLLLLFGQRFRGGVYAAGLVTPSEILKVTVVLFLATFVSQHAKGLSRWGKGSPIPPLRTLLPLVGFWVLLAALLVAQRDLGLFVVLSVALLVILLAGTGNLGYLVYATTAAVILAAGIIWFLPHGERRIDAWLSPFKDPTGGSWQILQGLSGMYSGGLWGDGFGRGSPEYTPIAQSDFIYSVIGEELGFAGCTILILFFISLFARGLVIAARTRDTYGRLIAVGLTTVLATQTFLNIGGVTKLIPLTGIPLPFLSRGGSSLITAFASLGWLLAISDGQPALSPRNRTRKKKTPAVLGGGVRRRTWR